LAIIHNSQKIEISEMSINGRMNKLNVGYPYNGILFGNKKEQSVYLATTWMSFENSELSEKANYKRPRIV
jgi:hypothetical protein